jgi:hypothetical protein
MLGELGTVLERHMTGTAQHPAQGWYAQLVTGEEVFLGDKVTIAAIRIQQLQADA